MHGYGRASGWGALPGRFRGALVLLGLAGAALVLARGRRLGPPQPAGRALAPARSDMPRGWRGRSGARDPAEAIAPGRPGSAQPVARSPRRRRDELLAAGLRAGLREDEAEAIAHGATTRTPALAAARGLARINERREEG